MVQAFNRHLTLSIEHKSTQARRLPLDHLGFLSSQMAHLPLCDFPWQSCSEVTVASLVSGVMVLLPFGEELTSAAVIAFLRNHIDLRLHC